MLTAGGGQDLATSKVYDMLRQKPGQDDVEEARRDEAQQLQITLLRYAANMAKATRESV